MDEVKPLIEQLQGDNYRLSEALVASVLERMGEMQQGNL
ncbi:MAG: hypothetical protein ACPGSM_22500 [Thiolinea sp.]